MSYRVEPTNGDQASVIFLGAYAVPAAIFGVTRSLREQSDVSISNASFAASMFSLS